jgi:hypothetical protein
VIKGGAEQTLSQKFVDVAVFLLGHPDPLPVDCFLQNRMVCNALGAGHHFHSRAIDLFTLPG